MEYVPNSHDDSNQLAWQFLEIANSKALRFGLDDAQDTVQQIALELWRKRDTVVLHPNPKAFIHSIARGRLLDRLTEESNRLRQEVSLTRWDERASTEENGEEASHRSRLPEAFTVPHPVERHMELEEARRRVAEVAAVIKGLSLKQRRIFGQCIVRKRSRKAVAEELGMSYGTLRNEVARLRKLLKDAVK